MKSNGTKMILTISYFFCITLSYMNEKMKLFYNLSKTRSFKSVYHYYITMLNIRRRCKQHKYALQANNEQPYYFSHIPETMVHSGHIIFNMRDWRTCLVLRSTRSEDERRS